MMTDVMIRAHSGIAVWRVMESKRFKYILHVHDVNQGDLPDWDKDVLEKAIEWYLKDLEELYRGTRWKEGSVLINNEGIYPPDSVNQLLYAYYTYCLAIHSLDQCKAKAISKVVVYQSKSAPIPKAMIKGIKRYAKRLGIKLTIRIPEATAEKGGDTNTKNPIGSEDRVSSMRDSLLLRIKRMAKSTPLVSMGVHVLVRLKSVARVARDWELWGIKARRFKDSLLSALRSCADRRRALTNMHRTRGAPFALVLDETRRNEGFLANPQRYVYWRCRDLCVDEQVPWCAYLAFRSVSQVGYRLNVDPRVVVVNDLVGPIGKAVCRVQAGILSWRFKRWVRERFFADEYPVREVLRRKVDEALSRRNLQNYLVMRAGIRRFASNSDPRPILQACAVSRQNRFYQPLFAQYGCPVVLYAARVLGELRPSNVPTEVDGRFSDPGRGYPDKYIVKERYSKKVLCHWGARSEDVWVAGQRLDGDGPGLLSTEERGVNGGVRGLRVFVFLSTYRDAIDEFLEFVTLAARLNCVEVVTVKEHPNFPIEEDKKEEMKCSSDGKVIWYGGQALADPADVYVSIYSTALVEVALWGGYLVSAPQLSLNGFLVGQFFEETTLQMRTIEEGLSLLKTIYERSDQIVEEMDRKKSRILELVKPDEEEWTTERFIEWSMEGRQSDASATSLYLRST